MADFARTNHMFLGRLERARCAVPLLIPVSSVIPRHEWLLAKRIRRDVLRSARGERAVGWQSQVPRLIFFCKDIVSAKDP